MFIRSQKEKKRKDNLKINKRRKGEDLSVIVSGPLSGGRLRMEKPRKKGVNYNKLSSTNQIRPTC